MPRDKYQPKPEIMYEKKKRKENEKDSFHLLDILLLSNEIDFL